ncbi:MAG: transcription elongation factor GreA [bacterium]
MVAKKAFYVTESGLVKLREELDDLVNVQRRKIAAALKEAKEFGDLSENASWDDAKERQAFIEGRIAEIEHILMNSVAIAETKSDIVAVGSTVHVELEDGEQKFQIVGSTEADPEQGMISNESPIGRALIGKKPGDEISVEVPAGTIIYKITKIV